MLEIRPNCENCNKDLPVDSEDACICTYECTFCRDCVDTILKNVCPNCGGGFVPRPIRPKTEWRPGVSRVHQTPSGKRMLKPVDPEEHQNFSASLQNLSPAER